MKTCCDVVHPAVLGLALEHVTCGVLVLDKDLTVQFMNPLAESLFARAATEMLGNKFPFPLTGRDLQETRVVHAPDGSRVAEMAVVQTGVNGDSYFIVSLVDLAAAIGSSLKLLIRD